MYWKGMSGSLCGRLLTASGIYAWRLGLQKWLMVSFDLHVLLPFPHWTCEMRYVTSTSSSECGLSINLFESPHIVLEVWENQGQAFGKPRG